MQLKDFGEPPTLLVTGYIMQLKDLGKRIKTLGIESKY